MAVFYDFKKQFSQIVSETCPFLRSIEFEIWHFIIGRRYSSNSIGVYLLNPFTWLQSMVSGDTLPSYPEVKLSIVTQFYPPDYAATGQLIEELATHLAKRGLKVRILTGQPGYAFEKESAPTIERVGRVLIQRSCISRVWGRRIRGRVLNGLVFLVRAGLRLFRPSNRGDVLLITSEPPYLPVLGYLANLCFGVPYVCVLYDLYPDIAVKLDVISRKHWLVRLWHAINQRVWQRASRIVVLSSSMKARLVDRCPAIAKQISVIHNWADPTQISPIEKSENWFAQKFDLVKKFTVLYSGNLGRCHDIETTISTIQQLQDETIQFVFIGNGAKRQTFVDRVEALGLSNCKFLPYQEKHCLPYSLTACDLSLVSLGEGMEGLVAPSKFYTALAAGRPILAICERHSYLHDLISEANCGATFEHGDCAGIAKFIRHLAANREQAEQMGRAGRHYLQANFTPEIVAQQYSEVLDQTLAQQMGASPLPSARHRIPQSDVAIR